MVNVTGECEMALRLYRLGGKERLNMENMGAINLAR